MSFRPACYPRTMPRYTIVTGVQRTIRTEVDADSLKDAWARYQADDKIGETTTDAEPWILRIETPDGNWVIWDEDEAGRMIWPWDEN